MRTRCVSVLAVVAITGCLAAGPASASDMVGAYQLNLWAGEYFSPSTPWGPDEDGCGEDGVAFPGGRGLYLPLTNSSRSEHSVFALNTYFGGYGVASASDGARGFSTVDICGSMSPAFDGQPGVHGPIGASCFASRGHDGIGTVAIGPLTTRWAVHDFGWRPSIGEVYAFEGVAVSTHGKNSQAEERRLVGLFSPAAWDNNCLGDGVFGVASGRPRSILVGAMAIVDDSGTPLQP